MLSCYGICGIRYPYIKPMFRQCLLLHTMILCLVWVSLGWKNNNVCVRYPCRHLAKYSYEYILLYQHSKLTCRVRKRPLGSKFPFNLINRNVDGFCISTCAWTLNESSQKEIYVCLWRGKRRGLPANQFSYPSLSYQPSTKSGPRYFPFGFLRC